jgi:putative ABC transport system substrate-binding protein
VGTNDPVGAGFIKSLAHPGGNVTSVAGMFADSIGKSVELLRAVLPTAKRMAVLTSSNPNHPRQYELAEAAGKALGLVAIQILAPASTDLEQAFDRMAQEKCDALFVLADQSGQPSFRWRQRRRFRLFINSALMSIWVASQATAPASR